MDPAKDDGDEPQPQRDRSALAAYYRQKAAECLRHGETAKDPATREEWVTLANGWTQLALQSQR